MANYHQLKNAAILTPTESTDLGSNANRYSNVFMSGNIIMSNGVTVTSTNVITPKIALVSYPANDTAADVVGGQTLTITGSGFSAGASVLLGTTPATVVTVVSGTSITFTSPALVAGTYSLYVINSDGGTAIYIPGVAYSGTPTWSTIAGSLATVYETNSISSTVAATGDATISYSLNSGTLPTGSTLNSSTGLISGTAPASAGSTTYSFVIRATDGQNQDTDRSFSITVDTDSVSWSSPADNTSTALIVDNAMSAVTLSATSAAGKSITYTANALPTGVSISTNTVVGTPTVEGTTTSLITATAATSGRTATRTLSWVANIAGDTYWMYTTLLLNGEGTAATNNANNNTIIDSSATATAITRNGEIVQGSFSPFSAGSWSNYFDGNGDYLQTPASVSSSLGTSNFTWECWIYRNAVTEATYADAICCVSTGTNGFAVAVNPDGKVGYAISSAGTWDVRRGVDPGDPRGSIVIPLNTWQHIALVRNGSTFTGYVNGAQDQTFTSSASISSISSNYNIGKWHDGNNRYWNGYISNFRFVIGTAVYTTTFTPPTSPLTAITNTSLLTCQSYRFVDNSTNNFTITRNGDVNVQKFSPLPGAAKYDPLVHGGSAYYSGSPWIGFSQPDYTSVFTLESWLYFPAVNSDKYLYVSGNSGPLIRLDSSGGAMSIGRQGGMDITVSTPYPIGQWFHFALVRQGTGVGQTKVYYNGVLVATGQIGNTFSAGAVGLGSTQTGGQAITGYISGWRLLSGTALYTSSFTPPTTPPTAIANTTLLLNFTKAGVIDQTGINNLITWGDAKISTAVKKYNSGSIIFDGSGDSLTIASSPLFAFGTRDFTVELWVYFNSISGGCALYDARDSGNSLGILIGIDGANNSPYFHVSGGNRILGTALSNATWYHIAVSRVSGSTKLFVNGTQAGSTYTDANNYIAGIPTIGNNSSGGGGTNYLNGYIDDFRITRGVARYTTTFTPPTSALIAR